VDAFLHLPGHPEVYAIGDAAAVPDLTKPADDHGTHPLCPPTAGTPPRSRWRSTHARHGATHRRQDCAHQDCPHRSPVRRCAGAPVSPVVGLTGGGGKLSPGS